MNNFMFNVKQLNMNKFRKYIWQLIISTSIGRLEVPSLRPWVPISCFSPNDLFKNWKKLLFWYYGQKFIVYTCHFFNIRITRCRAQMYITLPLAVQSDCGDAEDGNIGTYVDIHLFYNKKLCIWLRKRHMVKTGTIQKLSFLIFFEMELFWECWNPTC